VGMVLDGQVVAIKLNQTITTFWGSRPATPTHCRR
jgi:hypothetical protein